MRKDVALFLDVDGVLNNTAVFRSTRRPDPLDQACIIRMREVIRKTNVRIVLSSTWRHFPDCRNRVWKALKLQLSCYSATPDLHHRAGDRLLYETITRGHEIAAWLHAHPKVTRYAIVDDDNDMLPEQMPFFVQTSIETGLTNEHVQKLLKLLM